jgi:hypothetical protein
MKLSVNFPVSSSFNAQYQNDTMTALGLAKDQWNVIMPLDKFTSAAGSVIAGFTLAGKGGGGLFDNLKGQVADTKSDLYKGSLTSKVDSTFVMPFTFTCPDGFVVNNTKVCTCHNSDMYYTPICPKYKASYCVNPAVNVNCPGYVAPSSSGVAVVSASSSNTGMIVGIVIGVIAFLVIVGVIIYCATKGGSAKVASGGGGGESNPEPQQTNQQTPAAQQADDAQGEGTTAPA